MGGSGAAITLTETSAENDDATLNVAITAGLGVSAITNSTNTTTGVGGVKLTNNTGDGKDLEGVSLGTMSKIQGILLKSTRASGVFTYVFGTGYTGVVASDGFSLITDQDGSEIGMVDLVIASQTGATTVEITIVGQ